MTMQAHDPVIHRGRRYNLTSDALTPCWEHRERPRPSFIAVDTSCHRGYIATWEIRRNRFYLTGFMDTHILPQDAPKGRGWEYVQEVGIKDLFPGEKAPILADWLTGEISLGTGEIMSISFFNTYEKKYVLELEKGVIRRVREYRNQYGPADLEEGDSHDTDGLPSWLHGSTKLESTLKQVHKSLPHSYWWERMRKK